MKHYVVALGLLLGTLCFAEEWVIPWIANQDGNWGSELVINNHTGADVTVDLIAVRADGSTDAVSGVTIPAQSQKVLSANDTFTSFGSGAGYAVFVTSEATSLTVAVRVASLKAASGFSPAMGSGLNVETASKNVVYPVMPADGFSAPVFVNTSDETLNLTINAYTASGAVGDAVALQVEAKRPRAVLLTSLFPDLAEAAHLVVTGDRPFLGANFSFNSDQEPSMITATSLSEVTTETIAPLMATLDSTNTVSASYESATGDILSKTNRNKRACPDMTIDTNLQDTSQFISASFDWGTGCTSPLGIYHSGSLDVVFSLQGTITDPEWLTGTLNLHNLVTRYMEYDFSFNGNATLEADANSKNFTLVGQLAGAGSLPNYGNVSFDAETSLNFLWKDTEFRGYGMIVLAVDSLSNYTINGSIPSSDPLIYDFATCPWPTDGVVNISGAYEGVPYQGSLDFGTGNCYTATLTIYGRSETIDL